MALGLITYDENGAVFAVDNVEVRTAVGKLLVAASVVTMKAGSWIRWRTI